MQNVVEEWRPVKGYEGFYEVSNFGVVRSIDCLRPHPVTGMSRRKGRLLVPRKHTNGYLRVQLNGKDAYIHRLVALAFIGESSVSANDVNHKNGDKTDNRLLNLEWCNRSRNMQHAYDIGILKPGEARWNAKLTEDSVRELRRRYANKEASQAALAREYGVHVMVVNAAINRRTWKHVA